MNEERLEEQLTRKKNGWKKIFKGKAIQVVEQLKKEIIKEVKSIKLKGKNFESYGVDEIREDITAYIDFINLIYQDIIVGRLNFDDEIKSQLYVGNCPYLYYDYELIKKEGK